MPERTSMEEEEEGAYDHSYTDEEDWSEEDTKQFVKNMREEQRQRQITRSVSPTQGVKWTGLVLFLLIAYGVYFGHLMNFTLWVTALLVVLALGNKAIR